MYSSTSSSTVYEWTNTEIAKKYDPDPREETQSESLLVLLSLITDKKYDQPFFWNKLATQSTLPSVWTDLDSIPSSTLNLDDLVADFAVGSPAISKVSAGSGEKKKAVVSLLGLSRANNIGE